MSKHAGYMTSLEAAEYLGVTRTALYFAMKARKYHPEEVEGKWYYKQDLVELYKKTKYCREESRRIDGECVFDESKGQYSVRKVAEMYSVTTQRIYYCIRAGKLKTIRVGSTYVILIDDKFALCEMFAQG